MPKTKIGFFLCVALAAAGVAGGYFGQRLVAPPSLAAGGDVTAQSRITALQAELAVLKAEKEYLTGRVAQLSAAEREVPAREAVPRPHVAVLTAQALFAPFVLASVDEADPVFYDALAHIDLDAVLRVGAALLTMRQEGYEKFLALVRELNTRMENDQHLRAVFQDARNEGLGMRWCAENADNLLRFGIYLRGRESQDLPAQVRFLRERIDGDIGRMLLGFCGGGDMEIEQGFVSIYSAQISAALEEGGELEEGEVAKAISGLSLLRSEAATDMLVGLAAHVSPSVLETIAAALVRQGTPRALTALQTLREKTTDAKVFEDIDGVLSRRQGQAAR